jgi:hypothetical protein
MSYVMTTERFKELDNENPKSFTQEEKDCGWHWCGEYDYMPTTNKPEHAHGWTVCHCAPTPTNKS